MTGLFILMGIVAATIAFIAFACFAFGFALALIDLRKRRNPGPVGYFRRQAMIEDMREAAHNALSLDAPDED